MKSSKEMKYFAQLFTGLIIELDKPLHNYHTEAGYVIDKCVINEKECYNTVFATAHVYVTWEEKETTISGKSIKEQIEDLKNAQKADVTSIDKEGWFTLEGSENKYKFGKSTVQSYYGGMRGTETGELEYINGIQDYFWGIERQLRDAKDKMILSKKI